MHKVVALTLGTLALLPAASSAQNWQSIGFSRQRSAEQILRVDVEYGAGRFVVTPGAAAMLYRGRMRYDADVFEPDVDYGNGRLRISMEGGSLKGRNFKAGLLELALGTEVPLDLDLKFGAAEANLDLGGMRVTNAKISTGASRTELRVSRANPALCRMLQLEVGAASFEARNLGNLNTERLSVSGGMGEVVLDFSGEWRSDMMANISMGLGSLTLRVPRGVGVRVQKSGILASFDSQGLVKQGDQFYSQNWEQAAHKLTIHIDAALGSIRVAWIDG
jgi:hypothetical protein